MSHTCHAFRCEREVPPEMLMCKSHWAIVDEKLQKAVWAAYRPGQCDSKRPSEAWMFAANQAINSVMEIEIRRGVIKRNGLRPAFPTQRRPVVSSGGPQADPPLATRQDARPRHEERSSRATPGADGLRDTDAATDLDDSSGAPRCGECPFSQDGKPNNPVQSEGPKAPTWIALGEGPGRVENKLRRPFVGPSGKLIDTCLKSAGADRRQLLVTNALLCTPSRAVTDAEKKAAREACKPRLLAELRRHPGKPILAMGAHAAQALLGDKFSISKLAGSLAYFDGHPVISTIHPASILRGGDGQGGDVGAWFLTYDMVKVQGMATGRIKPPEFDAAVQTEIKIPARARQLIRDMLRECASEKFLSLDLETAGVNDLHDGRETHFCNIKAIGIGTAKRAVSVLWKLLDAQTINEIRKVLADPSILKVGQNHSIFDQGVLSRFNLRMTGNLFDVMLGHHAAFPGAPHTLQRIVTQFVPVEPWKSEFRAGSESPEELTVYNAKDVLGAAKVVKPLQIIIKRNQAEETYQTDVKMAYVAERMSAWGVPFDRTINKELSSLYHPFMTEALKKLRARVSDPSLQDRMFTAMAFEYAKKSRKGDPHKFADRIELRKEEILEEQAKGKWEWAPTNDFHIVGLLKALGVNLVRETKTGRTASGKGILQAFTDIAEVRAVLDYRENAKAATNFVDKIPLLLDGNGNTGRAHPQWSVHKISGRWAVKSPELHSFGKMKKRENKKLNLRRQVAAPPGRCLVGFDFKGAEARCVGFLSGSGYIIDAFKKADAGEGPDLHTLLTKEWHTSYDKISADARDAARDMTKRAEYGHFYGADTKTIFLTIVRDYPEVKYGEIVQLHQLMKKMMPEIPVWHEKLYAEIRQTGKLQGMARPRCYPLGRFDANEVKNFCAQEMIAFLMNRGLIRLYPRLRKLKECHPIIQHHDSLVVECREEDADQVRHDIQDTMAQTLTRNGRSVYFPIDLKVGASWAEV